MIKNIVAVLCFTIFSFFTGTINAQLKDVEVKDTIGFLIPHLKSSVGHKLFYKNGKQGHDNRYYVRSVIIKDCVLDAVVNLAVSNLKDTATFRYTLYYTIPLGDIEEVATETKADSTSKYLGAPLFFTTREGKLAIHYRMVEDLTGRTEADSYYNESTLWRIGPERKQVITLLKDLCKKCASK